jgi:hypothetical protein
VFDRKNVPIRINNIAPLKMDKDEREITLLRLDCEVEPFTPELAKELDSEVRTALYTRTDAEVKSKVTSIGWDLGIPPQAVEVRLAPDQDQESFTLLEVKIANIKTKRSKKSTAWRLTFSMTCWPATEHQSAQVIESYSKVRYMSMEPAQPDLFSESTKERTRAVRAEREQGIGTEAATAH